MTKFKNSYISFILLLNTYINGEYLSHDDLIKKAKELTILPEYSKFDDVDIKIIVFDYEARYYD